jgi:hypothetical protein
MVREVDPPRLGVLNPRCQGDVEAIAAKALEKEPRRRYASAAELAADLRRHLSHEPIAAQAPSGLYALRKLVRRHRALVAGAAATMTALLLGFAATFLALIRAVAARDEAGIARREEARHRREAQAFSRGRVSLPTSRT